MISKSKPTKGKIGFPYHIETVYKNKRSCSSCIYYEKEDGSCSRNPIVISEVGFNYFKICEYFEQRNDEEYNKSKRKHNERIAKTTRYIISNNGNIKELAKSFNLSIYKLLVIYNDMYGSFNIMNEENINKLREYGLSKRKIAEFYGVNEITIFKDIKSRSNCKVIKEYNKLKSNKNLVVAKNDNAIEIKEKSNSICGLCKNKNKHKQCEVYYIDKHKNNSVDSIFNMIVLCKKCSQKVEKNSYKYEEKLKEIAKLKAEEIIELQ